MREFGIALMGIVIWIAGGALIVGFVAGTFGFLPGLIAEMGYLFLTGLVLCILDK